MCVCVCLCVVRWIRLFRHVVRSRSYTNMLANKGPEDSAGMQKNREELLAKHWEMIVFSQPPLSFAFASPIHSVVA